ncbi:MAG: GIY-YIG nuclease family protein [Pyrinomonadaceae bacterium]|nr:GIY-YIG nuclease family protein [Chthoniobacterales bacterium]MBA3572223.1 GIY-YIG nuclease family protein [Pyrinomonadaceae bacterium]
MTTSGAYVYLIREGARIKVGSSKSVISRLKLFQTGNAEQCHVVAAIWLLNAQQVEKQLKDDLAEYRHRGEWFNVSTKQAVAKLLQLRNMFLYDGQPQLDLPTPENPLEKDCRTRFFEWIKREFPHANPRACTEQELWTKFSHRFLKEHHECRGVELRGDFFYDLPGDRRPAKET